MPAHGVCWCQGSGGRAHSVHGRPTLLSLFQASLPERPVGKARLVPIDAETGQKEALDPVGHLRSVCCRCGGDSRKRVGAGVSPGSGRSQSGGDSVGRHRIERGRGIADRGPARTRGRRHPARRGAGDPGRGGEPEGHLFDPAADVRRLEYAGLQVTRSAGSSILGGGTDRRHARCGGRDRAQSWMCRTGRGQIDAEAEQAFTNARQTMEMAGTSGMSCRYGVT